MPRQLMYCGRALAPILALTLVLAACGSDSESSTTTPTPTASATSTGTPTPEPTPSGTTAPEPTSTETSTPTPTATPTETATPEPTPTQPPPGFIEVEYANGAVVGGVGRARLPVGEQVELHVTADVTDEVHVHGYDVFGQVAPGVPAVLQFEASIPGVWEVELEGLGHLLIELEVS